MSNQYKEIENKTRKAYYDALSRLIHGIQTHPKLKGRRVRITPTTVALEARRSRNPLYTTHKGVLKEIKSAEKRPTTEQRSATSEDKINELRETVKKLIGERRKLASENADLFYRLTNAEKLLVQKDQEIAQLMQKLDRMPVLITRSKG